MLTYFPTCETKVLSMAGFGNAGLPQRMLNDAEATDAAFNP